MKLIDADALFDSLIFPNDQWKATFKELLDDEPTVDPVDNMLDEIGKEIEQKAKDYDEVLGYRDSRGLWIALGILNKYKDKREETR